LSVFDPRIEDRYGFGFANSKRGSPVSSVTISLVDSLQRGRRRNLSRTFPPETGMTIPQYVRRLRMERAAGYGKKKLEIAVATRSRLLRRLFFAPGMPHAVIWGTKSPARMNRQKASSTRRRGRQIGPRNMKRPSKLCGGQSRNIVVFSRMRLKVFFKPLRMVTI
jgi:hypothetical protein